MISRNFIAATIFCFLSCSWVQAYDVNLYLTVENNSSEMVFVNVTGSDYILGQWYYLDTDIDIWPQDTEWCIAFHLDDEFDVAWDYKVTFCDWQGNVLAVKDAEGSFHATEEDEEIVIASYDGHAEPDSTNPQKDVAKRGEPYNVINGAVFRNETDLVIPARGFALTFGRSYNSSDSGGQEFGPGWRASTEWNLEVPADEQSILRIRDGEGRTFSFVKTGAANSGSPWLSDCDARMRVTHDPLHATWTLDGRDGGIRMNFNADGRWTSTDDLCGNTLTAGRDVDGHLTNVVHSCGLSFSVAWTSNRIASVTGPDGLLSVDYAYTSSGVLTSAVRRAASGETMPRTYQYDSLNYLTNAVNALGQAVTYSYAQQSDGTRRCVGNAYGDGMAAANAAYDIDDHFVTITYPVSASTGRTEVTHLLFGTPRIASVEMGGETMAYSYDYRTLEATGIVWSSGSQTAAVHTVLDSSGRPLASTFRLGATPGPETHTEWDSTLDLPLAEVDSMGWRTEYTWTDGHPISVRQTNGLGGWITTSYGWANGMLHDVTDPNGNYTSFWRDPRGNVTYVNSPVDPRLSISNDILGRPVYFNLPGEDSVREWSLEYDGFGRVVRAVAPDGLDTHHYYDALGHMTGMVDRADRRTDITYGTAGKPLHIERTVTEGGSNRTVNLDFEYNLQLEPTAIRDSLGRSVESRKTDAAGRIAEVTNIEGRVSSIDYGVLGLPLAVMRFDGSRITFGYDAGARLVELGLPGYTNTFTWLDNGLLASATDGGILVTNEWIAPGRLAAQETRTAGWSGRVAYKYDLGGAVTQTVAAAIDLAQAVSNDVGSREVSRVVTCRGTTLSTTREYAYWNGLPSLVGTGPVEQRFGWDRLDRLTNLTWKVQDTVVRSMDFNFDVLGFITQRVDRAAGVATVRRYTYDDLDRLTSETKIQEPGITNLAVYSYDDVGHRAAKTSTTFDVQYANGIGDRLAGWVVTRTNTPGCTLVGCADETIGTDLRFGQHEVSGGIRAATPSVNGSNFSAQVAFDVLGEKTVVATVSDVAGNVGVATNNFVLAAYTAGDYLADDAGCVTQIIYRGSDDRQERALTWDSEYRLTAVATNGVAAETYGYDPFGRRSWTATAGVTNRHLYDGAHVLADLDATGGVIRTYLYGPGIDELIAMTVHTGTVAQTYYAIRDHQNTIWAWADVNGAIIESYDFDPWGRVLGVFGSSGFETATGESQIGNRYLWQGREYSFKTGLYYFRNRWADPVTGRWLTCDPIGISGGLNQFVMMGNNPVNFTDSLGLSGHLIIMSIRGDRNLIGSIPAGMHSLVAFIPDNGSASTWSTWGRPEIGKTGVRRNDAGDLTAMLYDAGPARHAFINDQQEIDMLLFIVQRQGMGPDAWSTWSPCSDFASDLWFATTGERLQDRRLGGLGYSDPNILADSIDRKNKGDKKCK